MTGGSSRLVSPHRAAKRSLPVGKQMVGSGSGGSTDMHLSPYLTQQQDGLDALLAAAAEEEEAEAHDHEEGTQHMRAAPLRVRSQPQQHQQHKQAGPDLSWFNAAEPSVPPLAGGSSWGSPTPTIGPTETATAAGQRMLGGMQHHSDLLRQALGLLHPQPPQQPGALAFLAPLQSTTQQLPPQTPEQQLHDAVAIMAVLQRALLEQQQQPQRAPQDSSEEPPAAVMAALQQVILQQHRQQAAQKQQQRQQQLAWAPAPPALPLQEQQREELVGALFRTAVDKLLQVMLGMHPPLPPPPPQ